VSVPVPENIKKDPPAFDAWVEFIGYVKEPALFPGSPSTIVEGNIYHCPNKASLINDVNTRIINIGFQRGMLAFKPEFMNKVLTPEQLLDPTLRFFAPMENLRYVDIVIKPMTELPRVEEPGVPLTGQGSLETVEHKPS